MTNRSLPPVDLGTLGVDGVVSIAKSATRPHLRANLVALSIELTHEQRQHIDDHERGQELFPE